MPTWRKQNIIQSRFPGSNLQIKYMCLYFVYRAIFLILYMYMCMNVHVHIHVYALPMIVLYLWLQEGGSLSLSRYNTTDITCWKATTLG